MPQRPVKTEANDSSDDDICYLPTNNTYQEPGPGTFQAKTEPEAHDDTVGFDPQDYVNGATGQCTYIRPVNGSKKRQDSPDYKVDTSEEARMLAMGLPASFNNAPTGSAALSVGSDEQVVARKGEKETFYCELCEIELNSRDTMTSHMKGQKHVKKMHDAHRKNAAKNKAIIKVPNPMPHRKKVTIRLEEKLHEISTEPIVGLRFIMETVACSSPEAEALYECVLCGMQGEANHMVNHLVGKGHKEKFLQKTYPDDPSVFDLNKRELERRCESLSDQNPKLINTIHSDELYKWTPGKAPWSLEKGGTGIAPSGAKERMDERRRRLLNQDSGEEEERGIFAAAGIGGGPASVLDIRHDDVRDPSAPQECQKYLQLVQTVFERASGFMERSCSSRDSENVRTLRKMLNTNIAMLKNIPMTRPPPSSEPPRPSTSSADPIAVRTPSSSSNGGIPSPSSRSGSANYWRSSSSQRSHSPRSTASSLSPDRGRQSTRERRNGDERSERERGRFEPGRFEPRSERDEWVAVERPRSRERSMFMSERDRSPVNSGERSYAHPAPRRDRGYERSFRGEGRSYHPPREERRYHN